MTLTSQQAALLLCRIPNLGPRRIKKLIDHCDGAKNVLKATLDKLLKINGVGPSHIKYLEGWKAHLPQLKKEEKRIKKSRAFLWATISIPCAKPLIIKGLYGAKSIKSL